jgi:alpha-glucosidase
MRYAQWALLTPVARHFVRPPAVDDTRLPWSHGRRAEASFRRAAELRYRLLPTLVALAWESHLTGLPLLRPMVLEFQGQPQLAAVYDQAMLGDRLMLAPVVEPGATRQRILLPAGTWYDFWSDQPWTGDDDGRPVDYPAPLDRLPLLVRGGTMLLLGPTLACIPDNHQFDRLELHLWPPFPAECRLYDDDGRTRACQRRAYSVTRFSAQGDENRLVITVGPAAGSFPEQMARRRAEVILHGGLSPRQAAVAGGAPLEGLEQTRPAVIRLDCPTDRETRVEVSL